MMYRFLPPLLLLFGIHTVFAKDLMIDYWSVSLDREPLPQQSVNVGDTVTFKVLGRTHVLYLLLRGMHSTHISPCLFFLPSFCLLLLAFALMIFTTTTVTGKEHMMFSYTLHYHATKRI